MQECWCSSASAAYRLCAERIPEEALEKLRHKLGGGFLVFRDMPGKSV